MFSIKKSLLTTTSRLIPSMLTRLPRRVTVPTLDTYKKINLRKNNVYNTYISLTIYINKFQNVKSESRIVRSVSQLSFTICGLCWFYMGQLALQLGV